MCVWRLWSWPWLLGGLWWLWVRLGSSLDPRVYWNNKRAVSAEESGVTQGASSEANLLLLFFPQLKHTHTASWPPTHATMAHWHENDLPFTQSSINLSSTRGIRHVKASLTSYLCYNVIQGWEKCYSSRHIDVPANLSLCSNKVQKHYLMLETLWNLMIKSCQKEIAAQLRWRKSLVSISRSKTE